MNTLTTTTRNSTLADFAALLQDQHARKVDMVVPSTAIEAVNGNLVIRGAEPMLTEDGVDLVDGTYRPGPWRAGPPYRTGSPPIGLGGDIQHRT